MVTPIEAGGCRSRLAGGPFLEEFPRLPPSHLIQGCTIGLFGLYDMADALNHLQACAEAARVEATLAENIMCFVTPTGWSYYGLNVYGHRYLSSVNYHRQNILGIGIVASRTRSEALRTAARRWRDSFEHLHLRPVNAFAKGAQVVWLRDIKRLPLRLG